MGGAAPGMVSMVPARKDSPIYLSPWGNNIPMGYKFILEWIPHFKGFIGGSLPLFIVSPRAG